MNFVKIKHNEKMLELCLSNRKPYYDYSPLGVYRISISDCNRYSGEVLNFSKVSDTGVNTIIIPLTEYFDSNLKALPKEYQYVIIDFLNEKEMLLDAKLQFQSSFYDFIGNLLPDLPFAEKLDFLYDVMSSSNK